MYSFLLKPRWIALTVVCLAVLPGFKALSDWQWNRLHQREAYNRVIGDNMNRTVTVLSDVATSSQQFNQAAEWTILETTGTWDTAHQVLVRKKSFQSEVGFWVVTPFVTSDTTIMVNRGWIIAGNSAIDSPTVQNPPAGEVTIQGRVRIIKSSLDPQPADLPSGQVDRIVPTQIALSDRVIANGYLELIQSKPDSVLELKTMAAPEISEGPHRSYALQWIFFALMTIAGWIILVRNEVTRQQTDQQQQTDGDVSLSTTHPA